MERTFLLSTMQRKFSSKFTHTAVSQLCSIDLKTMSWYLYFCGKALTKKETSISIMIIFKLCLYSTGYLNGLFNHWWSLGNCANPWSSAGLLFCKPSNKLQKNQLLEFCIWLIFYYLDFEAGE